MTDEIRAAVSRLAALGSFMLPGATDDEIEDCNALLEACGGKPLPEDYVPLLRQANGLQCPVFTLYPTGPATLADSNIGMATMKEIEDGYVPPCHVLGRLTTGGMPLVRDIASSRYHVLDGGPYEVLYEYDSIAAFINGWLDKKKL